MRYLLLPVLLCGCTSMREDTFIIHSINSGDQNYKYEYTIRTKIDSKNIQDINVRSNKEFRVGGRVELTLVKEN